MAVLWINDVQMPDPSAITVTKEPVWSSNAGRGSTGIFIGDIVCYKFKLQIKWPCLSERDTSVIDGAIASRAFFAVKFKDPTNADGDYITKTMYAGTPTYPVYSYADGLPKYVGVTVNLIEQ